MVEELDGKFKIQKLTIKQLITERLILIPFTIQICKNVLAGDYTELDKIGLIPGKNWPDKDVLETLPRIINNLSRIESPTGLESWMIIKKETFEIIGDAGFKGFNIADRNIDLGYGIIKEERRKGYAEEAARVLIQWAFTNEILKEITASCSIENLISVNLLRKLRFTEIKNDNEMMFWSLQKKDWQEVK